ncbi:MAG TPA: hypothetical protein VGK19_12295 [Capsulimonadaceae bacterium]
MPNSPTLPPARLYVILAREAPIGVALGADHKVEHGHRLQPQPLRANCVASLGSRMVAAWKLEAVQSGTVGRARQVRVGCSTTIRR